jgi:hypothetical protein
MSKFKTSLLVATMIAGVVASPAMATQAQGNSTTPGALNTYVTDQALVNVPAAGAPLSLGDNPFAIEAPGNPVTTDSGTGYSFDGDLSVHGAGATSVQNVLVRAMNCLGTPNLLGNGQAVLGGTVPAGSLKALAATTYAGTPAMNCDNGTFSAATSAPTNGILYSSATSYSSAGVADTSKNYYFVPGSYNYEVQPQFYDYAISTGNVAPYGFSGKYIGSGSGLGQKAWAWARDVFDDGFGFTKYGKAGGASQNVPNPFYAVGGQNRWSHVQFAVSDAPIVNSTATGGQYATYQANAASLGGAAIEIPLFVTPIAIVYNSVYAGVYPTDSNGNITSTTATKLMKFNVKGTANYSGTKVASMQLTGPIYCAIFNGMITNWNDPALTAANKGVALYDPVNDTPLRWATEGAPIRLVARMDNSGTTDIFTRHLATLCSLKEVYGTAGTSNTNYFNSSDVTAALLPVADKHNFVSNKYLQDAQSMPYNAGPNFTAVRSDTHLNGSAYSSANDAGSVNTISGDFYNNGVISNIGVVDTVNYTGTAVFPSTPIKFNGSGLFIVANGGSDVAKLINLAPDYAPSTGGGSSSVKGILFNGKIGYISADVAIGVDATFSVAGGSVVPAVLAALPNSYSPTGGIYSYTYYAPTVKNALSAFNKTDGTLAFLPPESTNTGAFAAVNQTVNTSSTDTTGKLVRSNVFAWNDMFYNGLAGNYTAAGVVTTPYSLALPSQGYPVVGTTQLLTYTCFASKGNRQAIADLLGTLIGAVTVDSTNSKINKTAFSSSSASTPGIIAASTIGIVPSAWQTAILNTFLKGAGSDINDPTSGAYASTPLNFTSSVVPTKTKINGQTFYLPTTPNAACAEGGNGTSGGLAGL